MANTTGRKLKQKSSSEKKTVTIKRQSTAKKEKKKKGKAADVTVDVDLELSGSEGYTPKEFEVEIEYVTKCRPLSRIYIKCHRWTKDLTWKLVNGILDDAEVKQGHRVFSRHLGATYPSRKVVARTNRTTTGLLQTSSLRMILYLARRSLQKMLIGNSGS